MFSTATSLKKTQTAAEEFCNSVSHGIGFLLSVAGLVFIIFFASGNVWQIVSGSVYGASMALLYSVSMLYHGCARERLKRILRIADHICIALFIAGTYTPFTLVTLHGPWGWSLFGIIWTLALATLVFSLFFTGKSDLLAASIYLVMGWTVLIAAIPLFQSLALGGSLLLLAGGVIYSVGTFFFLQDHRPFYHFIWHIFVLGGSICHYWAIFLYVIL